MKNISELKILLLQIRDQPLGRKEELESFLRYGNLNNSQITVLNVFDKAEFPPNVIDGYDALFVGGASEANVLQPETYTFVPSGIALLNYCLDKDISVFASCFGFQMAVLALGGEILHKDKDFEMGSILISLTEAAKNDLVFKDSPEQFHAIAVHQQYSIKAPPQCEELALTNECCHAFKVRNKNFWAFQFHPEVDKNVLIQRLTLYKEKYTKDSAHLDSVLKSAVETPDSNRLLSKFIDRVLLKGL